MPKKIIFKEVVSGAELKAQLAEREARRQALARDVATVREFIIREWDAREALGRQDDSRAAESAYDAVVRVGKALEQL